MNKRMISIMLVVFVLLPLPCFASYIIYLKDGTKFVTDQYFEEGDQIRFKRYGGLIGIQKDLVREIVETETTKEATGEKESPPEVEKSVDTSKQDVPEKTVKGEEAPKKDAAKEKKEQAESTDYEREKKALMEKYFELRQRLQKAILAKDRVARETAEWEMSEVLKKLSALERKQKESAQKKE